MNTDYFLPFLPCRQVCRKIWIALVIQHPAQQDNPVFRQFKKLIPGLVNGLANYKIKYIPSVSPVFLLYLRPHGRILSGGWG